MERVHVHCYGCDATLSVATTGHPEDDLRRSGWQLVHGETYCPACSAARVPLSPAPAEPSIQPSERGAVSHSGSAPSEGNEIYILSTRVTNALIDVLAIAVCLWLAGFVSSQVAHEHREHLKAGGPVFVLFIGVLVLVAAFMGYRALRAVKLGITATASGITIHNMRRDLRIDWSDIAQFETTVVGRGQFRSAAARVRLKDGSNQLIQGTEYKLALSQGENEKVDHCVLRLNALLAGAISPSTGSTVALPRTPSRAATAP